MRLNNIIATPHPAGNRIDIQWDSPDPTEFKGVLVVRREGSYPADHKDGEVLKEKKGLGFAVDDESLKGEVTYYYALFPYKGDPPEYRVDPHNRAVATATSPYNFGGQMYELLPAIYHRYDTLLPRDAHEGDNSKGQLQGFLEIPGAQLDQLYSFAKTLLDIHNPDRIDGRLLPLLAEWIGWKTDYRLAIKAQRNEIRNAPALYGAIGLVSTVEATVKRVSGWEVRTKEFVHNVFLSNNPERFNIWAHHRDANGVWTASEPDRPISLDFAYEGRPTIIRDPAETYWLFYHTLNHQWNIWFKTSKDGQQWSPSQPLTDRGDLDKHPTAVVQDTTLWVFWNTYNDAEKRWRIDYRKNVGGSWSLPETFGDVAIERRLPTAVTDNTGGLWLFWLEKTVAQWQLKYNRHNGVEWQLNESPILLDGLQANRIDGDIAVFFHPNGADQPIWVFWTREEPINAEQTYSNIVYRTKQSIDPNVLDWSVIRTFPKTGIGAYHDREPAVVLDAVGNIECFWSSNQAGSWSIWRNSLDVITHTFAGDAQQITTDAYSQRTPLPISLGADTLLIYRSNTSLNYKSKIYSATQTTDFRYADSTTVDSRNSAKNNLRGKFEDFQCYTYDAGLDGQRSNENWYAFDTIGLYLTADTNDPEKIAEATSQISQVIGEFMPITNRVVFLFNV